MARPNRVNRLREAIEKQAPPGRRVLFVERANARMLLLAVSDRGFIRSFSEAEFVDKYVEQSAEWFWHEERYALDDVAFFLSDFARMDKLIDEAGKSCELRKAFYDAYPDAQDGVILTDEMRATIVRLGWQVLGRLESPPKPLPAAAAALPEIKSCYCGAARTGEIHASYCPCHSDA